MICPSCAREMEHLSRHGVELDRCTACGGIWLDRGELETLLEAVRAPVVLGNPDPARPAKPRPIPRETPLESLREDRQISEKRGPKPGKGYRYQGKTSKTGKSHKYSTRYRVKKLLDEIFD